MPLHPRQLTVQIGIAGTSRQTSPSARLLQEASMARPSLVQALVVALALFSPSIATAQRHETARLSFGVGAYVLAPGAVARAFNTGADFTLTGTVHLAGRLALRAGFAGDLLPYDQARFFRQLGHREVDLASQQGGEARLTTWSAGPEVTLWRTSSGMLSAFTTVGRVSRSTSTDALVYLYCDHPNVVRVDPNGCAQAEAETRIRGTAGSIAIGAVLRWRDDARSCWLIEAGYARTFQTPVSAGFPVRLGWGFAF
jgi:hypothetical protein